MLEVHGLAKSFGGQPLFQAIDLDVAAGEWVAVVGESGSGKSTLLNIVAGIDRPDRGTVRLGETALDYGDDDALSAWRRRNVGFVFQAFHLLPYLDVEENVALPLALLGEARAPRLERARAMLASMGLTGFERRKPTSLSGGEAQRAAIARALVHRPALLLADEPTGNLDEATGEGIHQLLVELNQKLGIAAIVVTHNPRLAERMPRRLRLQEGLVIDA